MTDSKRAGELYELLLPYRDRAILVGRGALCHGPAELYLGLVGSTCGRPEAQGHLEAALAWADAIDAHLIAAWARVYLAELFLRRRSADVSRAIAEASAASAVAQRSGFGRIAWRVKRLLAATGAAPETIDEGPAPSSVSADH